MSLSYSLYLDSVCMCSCVAAWRLCPIGHLFVVLNAFQMSRAWGTGVSWTCLVAPVAC